MAENEGVLARIRETLDLAAQCFEAERGEGYAVLSQQLEGLEALARETFQDHTTYKSLVNKLEKGNPLTGDELNTLKLLMIGDADYYLKYEDDFDRWKSELKRIVEEIRKLQSSNLDIDGLMHLRALCREAYSVVTPTGYYLEQKERIRKFEEATRDPIDRESGGILEDMIKRMLASDKM